MAYANGYDFRRNISIDNTKVSADATDFPVLISETIADLADTTNGGNVQSSNGDDIRFELQDWNIATSYLNDSSDISTNVSGPEGVFFKDDGTKMYIADYNDPSSVEEYTLSTPWDVSTKTHSYSLDVSSNEFSNCSVHIGDNGTKLFIGGDSSVSIWMYDMSTAWDLSTASYTSGNTFDVSGESTVVFGTHFKPDGTRFYIVDGENIHQYDLSVAWDVTSASFVSSLYIADNLSSPEAIRLHPDGDIAYILEDTSGIYQYPLSTTWDISSGNYNGVSRDVSDNRVWGLFFKPDGSHLFFTDGTKINDFLISTKIFHELDHYDNTTGELVSHVRMPFLNGSVDSDVYIYYGNSDVTSPEENPSGTWNPDFLSVFHLKDENANTIGEYHTQVLNDSIDGGHVSSVTFDNSYTDPVVIVFMATFSGSQACGVRAKVVGSDGCDVFMQEPDGGTHTDERVYFMVMEKGQHTLPGGAQVEVGVESTNSVHTSGDAFGGPTVTFSSTFASTPAIFHTLNTYANSDFMETVAHSVTTSDFQVEQEAGASGNTGTTEDIAWIAIEPTIQDWFEVGISTAGSNCGVDDGAHTISYTNGFNAQPNIVVKGNSGNGNDGYWARAAANYDGTASGNSSVDVYAEEDQVGDSEQSHAAETFGFMAFNKRTGHVFDSSDALTDSTGNHAGHLAGKPSFVTGQVHQGLSLTLNGNSKEDFIDTQHHYTPDWDVSAQLGFTGWVKFDDIDNQYTIFGERDASGTGVALQLRGDEVDDPLYLVFFGVGSDASAATGIAAGSWHHIAVTYDESNTVFYVDGAQISSHAQTTDLTNQSGTSHTMFIGANDAIGKPALPANADIDEPRFLKSALTGDWISTEFNNQNDPSSFYDVGVEYQESVTQDVTHTSDAVIRTEVDITHTSDSKLRAEVDVTHTGDSKLRAEVDVTHTSDAVVRAEVDVTHTSDGKLRAAVDVMHTSDAKLRATVDITHMSDAVLWVRRQHTSDAKLRGAFDVTHTSDAYLGVIDYDTAPHTYIGPQTIAAPAMFMPTGAYSDVTNYGGDDPEMDSPDYTMDDSSAIMGFSYEYGDRPSMADVGDTKPRMR